MNHEPLATYEKHRDAGTGGAGAPPLPPPCLLRGAAREAKVLFKYKEYYIRD